MPSQKQLRWAQLRVGITVIFAAITLAFLVFLMSGTTGIFTPKLYLTTYVDSAGGLRNGAPVRLQSVDIGNVQSIRIVNHTNQLGQSAPVEIRMKINSKFQSFIHKDSVVTLSTAGVLGETYIDIDSTQAKGPVVQNGGELSAKEVPDIQDVVRSSQSTLQNINTLIVRADRIVSAIENAQGSVGKLIYDKQLYNNLNSSVNQVQSMLNDINNGRGSIGKLLKDEEMYNRANNAVDKLNAITDSINNGEGTIGKLVKDPSLYNNANQTIAKANQLMDSINRGEGGLGMIAKDPEFKRKLDTMITNLSNISARLDAGEGSAGKLLRDPSLYNNTNSMLVESRALIQAVRQDPKKYLSIKLHIF